MCYIKPRLCLYHTTVTLYIYHPQTKLREGNTPVCDSVDRGGSLSRGSLSGRSLFRGVSVQEVFLQWGLSPMGVSVQGWGLETPPYGGIAGSLSWRPRTVKEWAICILLECILV